MHLLSSNCPAFIALLASGAAVLTELAAKAQSCKFQSFDSSIGSVLRWDDDEVVDGCASSCNTLFLLYQLNLALCQRRSESGIWTQEENKRFEVALAKYDRETPERREQVASVFPRKTVVDVMNHYNELLDDVTEIEVGWISRPRYSPSSFTGEQLQSLDDFKQAYCIGGKEWFGWQSGSGNEERFPLE